MSAEKLTVTVHRILHRSPEGDYVAARVIVPGGAIAVVTGPGDLSPPLESKLRLELIGQWVDHSKYGRQFSFAAYSASPVQDRAGVVRYLMDLIPGITEGAGLKLYAAYAHATLVTLREYPATVTAAGLLPADLAFAASKKLTTHKRHEQTTVDLITILGGKGFQLGALVPWCIDRWSVRAPELVRRNPFALLLANAPSVGWKRADALYTDLGHNPAKLKRQALAAVHAVTESRAGHTWHDARVIAAEVRKFIGPLATPNRAIKLAIRGGLLAVWRGGVTRVALARDAKAESDLARHLTEVSRWSGRSINPKKPGSASTLPMPSVGIVSTPTPGSAV